MSNLLQPAQCAADLQDWASVNEYLQKILILSDLPAAEILPLALQVLEFGDFQQRWDVVKLIPKLGEIAIAPLLEILADEAAEIELRWFAGGILADFHHPQVIESLVNIINTSPEAELTEMAIATLGKIGSPAIEAISQLLTAPSTRLLAVQTLAQIHLSQTITPLLGVVTDPQVEVRTTAISALSSFHDSRITAILMDSLRDFSSEVRKVAVTGLGLQQDLVTDLDLVKYIQPLLNDLNLEVCIASAIVLGRMGTDAAAIALFNRLEQGDAVLDLQLAIVRAIAWIETPKALEYLQQLLNSTPVPLSQEIINRLGNLTTPSLQPIASQILQSFLNSEAPGANNSQIQQSVATTLGELRQIEAIDSLIQLLANPDLGVRLHAIAALKRIAPDLAHQKLLETMNQTDLNPDLATGIAIALEDFSDRATSEI
jgi:HEAT repeat protein